MATPTPKNLWHNLRVPRTLTTGLSAAFGFSFFVNLLVLTSPIFMLQVFDRVLMTGQVETLIYLTIIAAVALLVMGLLDGVRGFLLARTGRHLDDNMRQPLLEALLGDTGANAGNQRRLIEDVSTVRGFFGGQSVLPLIDAPWVPFFIGVITLMHPWLGALALGAAIVLFAIAFFNDRLTRKQLSQASGQQYAATEFASSAVENAEVIRAMGMRDTVSGRYRHFTEAMSRANQIAADRGTTMSALSKALRMLVQVGILALGAYLVTRADLTPGGMIAASIVLGRALAPVEQLIGAWRMFVNARDSYERLRTFLLDVPVGEEAISLPRATGHVRVENVSYRVAPSNNMILNRVGLELAPGTSLAVIGPSASGKSSLCRLLVGAWKPAIGTVRVDGADVAGLNPTDARNTFGYLPQDVELFSGSVKDNIARLGQIDDAAVIAAAKAAGCHDAILQLPAGYETELGPQGMFLSGGQRQRIGLARAFYGNPPVVVLDEPNANLDQEGEAALFEAVSKLKQNGSTVIIVSHRVGILQLADKVALLRAGRLERFGDRDDVLRELAPKSIRSSNEKVPVTHSNAPANAPAARSEGTA